MILLMRDVDETTGGLGWIWSLLAVDWNNEGSSCLVPLASDLGEACLKSAQSLVCGDPCLKSARFLVSGDSCLKSASSLGSEDSCPSASSDQHPVLSARGRCVHQRLVISHPVL